MKNLDSFISRIKSAFCAFFHSSAKGSNLSLFHKKAILFSLLIVLLFTIQQGASAADYHLSSSSGDDGRSAVEAQNPDTPWQSISKLNEFFSQIRPGDRVLFKRGDSFFGSIQVDASGIFLGTYGSGDLPVITSLKTIHQWVDHGGGIFYSTLDDIQSEDLAIVLLDGKLQEMGRYPNSDASNGGYLYNTAVSPESLTGPEIPFNATGGEVVMRKNNWIIDRFQIKSQTVNTLVFTNDSTYPTVKGYGYFIQKHLETLDHFGEWYFDIPTKRLYVFFGNKAPENHVVEAAMLENLVVTKDKTLRIGIKLEELNLKGANSNIVDVNHTINFQLSNCQLSYSGKDGIYLYATPNAVIEGNTLNYCLNNSIFFWHGGTQAQVVRNRISYTMPFAGMSQNSDLNGIGIYLAADSDGSIIGENQLFHTGYTGIYFGGDGVTVTKNLIDDFCKLKFDGGAIYTNSQNLPDRNHIDRVVDHNIVLNGNASPYGTPSEAEILIEGIYLDDNSRGLSITNNTIANVNGRGIYLHNARSTKIEGNILFNNRYGVYLSHDQLGNPIRDVVIQGNHFLAKKKNQRFIGISSILDDVDSIGSINNNYYLAPFSERFMFQDLSLAGGKNIVAERSLANWSTCHGFDSLSTYSDFSLSEQKIVSKELIKSTDFSSGSSLIAGTYHGMSSWIESGSNAATLRVLPDQTAATTLFIQIGKVAAGEFFWVETEAKAAKADWRIGVSLERSKSQAGFPSTLAFSNHGRMLSSTLNSEHESVVLSVPAEAGELFLNSINIYKTRTAPVSIEDKIFFWYNYSNVPVTIPLTGEFIDGKRKLYSTSIEIPPYSAKILVKKENR
ncbi:right-handed parallel beta-helix repeat-containing protein [Algoriphagus sp.]|uniref:right-handed parallel beta-helix repeat-containing protein n=1 Tax=Algoriphagus sp. TaxID=1872435 RepID=UPI003F70E8F3